MAAEAKQMSGGTGNDKMTEEMREAEEDIAEDNGEIIQMGSLEEGRADAAPSSPKASKKSTWLEGARNFSSFIFGPVFVQSFVLTFLGEWGDRSQIATIALGAAHVCLVINQGSCCLNLSWL